MTRDRDLIESALPSYELGTELGRGAWGIVFSGRHRVLGREVAIKQLPQAFAADRGVRQRFVHEARLAASLEHPHVVRVYDFVDRDDGICLLVMERCNGTVSDRFNGPGIATDEACASVLATCSALAYAHGAGVLHRDIKPENLLYDTEGAVKLGDFGIARALDQAVRFTATGTVVGTPAYMSPEQAAGEVLTPASDVYSTGVMLYELLSGRLPFSGADSIGALIKAHLTEPPRPLADAAPTIPASIAEVVDHALGKRPEERYGSAEAFGVALAEGTVRAFGPGWLRQRRFALHGAGDIAAATERDLGGAGRAGTIVVRGTKAFPDPDPATRSDSAPPPPGEGHGSEPPGVRSFPPPAAPQGSVPPVAPPPGQPWGPPPSSPPTSAPVPLADADPQPGPRSDRGPIIAASVAAVVVVGAIIAGLVLLLGGGDDAPTDAVGAETDADAADAGGAPGDGDADPSESGQSAPDAAPGAAEDGGDDATGEVPTAAPETGDPGAAAPAATGDGLRIGVLVDPAEGDRTLAMDLAVADLNDAGGVLGKPVTLLEPGIVPSDAERFIAEGASVVVGPSQTLDAQELVGTIGARVPLLTYGDWFRRPFDAEESVYRLQPMLHVAVAGVSDELPPGADVTVVWRDAPENLDGYGLDTLRTLLEAAGHRVQDVEYDLDADPAAVAASVAATEPGALVLFALLAIDDLYLALDAEGLRVSPELPIIATGDDGASAGLPEGLIEGVVGRQLDIFVGEPLENRLPTDVSDDAAQLFDAVVLAGLATQAAGSTDPAAVDAAMLEVSRNGEVCTSAAACLELLAAGADIDYDGISGPIDWFDNGHPSVVMIRRSITGPNGLTFGGQVEQLRQPLDEAYVQKEG